MLTLEVAGALMDFVGSGIILYGVIEFAKLRTETRLFMEQDRRMHKSLDLTSSQITDKVNDLEVTVGKLGATMDGMIVQMTTWHSWWTSVIGKDRK